MVYKDRFVAVVKCNGKVLREKDDTVTLPFGSEYSLLLKNLESRKAVVNVSIDGQDVVDGSLILDPNSEVELEGFLKGYQVKNKFKFIQKTEEITKHRGDRIDDGVIRIEYRFEKKIEEEIVYRRRYRRCYPPYIPYWTWTCSRCGCYPCCCPPYYYYECGSFSNKTDDSSVQYTFTNSNGEVETGTIAQSNDVQVMNCAFSDGQSGTPRSTSHSTILHENSKPAEDEGITVPGSHSGQRFSQGHFRELENNSHVITIKLRGVKSNMTPVKKPVTTKSKVSCPTCGTKSKSSADFCSKCGTALF